MTPRQTPLSGAAILVLEDDYYLARDLQHALETAGATVIGPFGEEADAAAALADARPDCAFVDVNLGAGPSFALSRQLLGSNIPFVFVTGYDAGIVPPELAHAPRLEKPVGPTRVVAAATQILSAALSD